VVPQAKVIKSRTTFSNGDKTTAKASLLFYQYASWSESKADQLLAYLAKIAKPRTLGGRNRLRPQCHHFVRLIATAFPRRSLHHFVSKICGSLIHSQPFAATFQVQ
jgi:hypothetical protein